jgi:hypothetical protein
MHVKSKMLKYMFVWFSYAIVCYVVASHPNQRAIIQPGKAFSGLSFI